jgi:acyl-CoA thioester hydrolase
VSTAEAPGAGGGIPVLATAGPVDRPPFRFAYRTRVGFDETDAQGIVYYGRYMPYFDRARVEYLRFLGLLGHGAGGRDFVMRAQHVDYLAPARFDDALEVLVRVRRLGGSSVTWSFAAHELDTGRPMVTAEQTMVQIDLEARRPLRVDERFRELVGGFELDVEGA